MLTWLIKTRIAAFENIYDHDAVAREILGAAPRALAAIAGTIMKALA